MALLWSDGFDRYSASADLDSIYTRQDASVAWNATAGVIGGPGIVCGSSFDALTKTVSSTLTAGGTFHMGFYLKVTSNSSNGVYICQIGTNVQALGATNVWRLMFDNGGTLRVNRHGDTTTVGTSAAGTIALGTWYFVELSMKWNTNANGGVIKVWVDGNLVIDTTGTDTNTGTVPSTVTGVELGTRFNFVKNFSFDDWIVWDEVGADFVYPQLTTTYIPIIETLSVDGADSAQFTPSAGSNFQNVDEAGYHDGDTTYNWTVTVGHVDTFTVADPATTPNYVFGIAHKTTAKVHIPAIRILRSRLISGATTTEGPDRTMTTAYVQSFDPYGKDPNTAAVWGTTAPAAVKIGYERQS